MNEVIVPSAGSLTVPARGFEELTIERGDLIIPRAKLLQALSPEVAESKFEGAKPGLIINSLMMDVLPPRFVPVFVFKNYIRFNPRKSSDAGYDPSFEPGAIIWRSNDHTDPRVIEETAFGPHGEIPIATTFLNFFSVFHEVTMPIVISFSKTSFRAGRELLSLAKYLSLATPSESAIWYRAYQLSTEQQKNDKGNYYTLAIKPLGLSSDAERHQAEAWWQEFSKKAAEIKVHEEIEEPLAF